MKVAECRAALYPLRTEHITLGSAYSDTAAVTSCSRQKQYVQVVNCNKLNKVFSLSSYSYTAPTALDIRQEVEQIRANVFYSTFLKRFYRQTTNEDIADPSALPYPRQ